MGVAPQDQGPTGAPDLDPEQKTRAWLPPNWRTELLLGVIICCAQVPESVGFAFLANVPPHVALHAAWMVGLICSVFGGRPAMINGATGAFASIISTFIPEGGEGLEYLFPSVMLAGVLMAVAARCEVSRFITLVPGTVMLGFCNGLGIVIGLTQLHPFKDEHHQWVQGSELWGMVAIAVTSMVIMEFLPKVPLRVCRLVPSSLVSVVVAIALEFGVLRAGLDSTGGTKTIGDVSPFSRSTAVPMPFFLAFDMSAIVLDAAGVGRILRQGVLLAMVGVMESLMTQEVVNTVTKSVGDPQKTLYAMSAANLVSGFMGGMGGNAMIGLSTINTLNGGRGRIAPTVTSIMVLVMVCGAYPVLNYIPVAALTGIMLVVVLHTFKWSSVPIVVSAMLPQAWREKYTPHSASVHRFEALVIVTVTGVTVLSNLVYSVLVGVALTSVFCCWELAEQTTVLQPCAAGEKLYECDRPFFFGSTAKLLRALEPAEDPAEVQVLFPRGVLDFSAQQALAQAAAEYASLGKTLHVRTGQQPRELVRKDSKGFHADLHVDFEEAPVPHIEPFVDLETAHSILEPRSPRSPSLPRLHAISEDDSKEPRPAGPRMGG